MNKLHKVPEAVMYKDIGIEINIQNPYYVHCDGEIIGQNITQVNISVIKNSLKVIKGKE